ncbi:sigma-54-dependent Fis family transcriptional regulator [Shewanella algicola]|uniref:Sigma-54 dependent transcriptional regulator n=1 Tax=Shewanella algicola TaxID=640633 RepID=A0A9X1ZCS4_9GAMM|nr:sigma-54 dependent transcriptional regulator [Shewanella algicola]MCL1106175.1 sigma-54 dependent transcriptional regulator [Shewanella algicola]GGP71231.1 sigma-54-dependent Fis family transcriptional regulator [Shewanella algicola]
MDTILIVDDNHAICQALALMIELHGYDAIYCHSPDDAIDIVGNKEICLVIQDMNFSRDTTSGEEGKQLFYALRQLQPNLPIILMTAWTQLETAVELVKAGAADYMGKPWDDAKLLTSVANLLSIYRLSQQNNQLSRVHSDRMSAINGAELCGLVFASGAMQRCVDLALQVARSDVSVMITGPNGAGKDKIADILQANSPLKDKPFIKVNIGALPMDLLEAELFGAEAGAFTGANKTRMGRFEAADGGTLFLDEIGNLPLSGQVKLLRVLQTGEFERLGSHQTRKVNVRVISATNADLADDIANGRFREDLFYRLNVIELSVPPLKQRQDDILPLIRHFMGEQFTLDKVTRQALITHCWSGNVRELENACKRASLLATSAQLTIHDFGLNILPTDQIEADSSHNNHESQSDSTPLVGQQDNAPLINEPDKQQIEAALTQHNGVIARVAKSFGLSRQALYRRMDKFGIRDTKL